MSLCVVDLLIASFRFKAYINLRMFDAWLLHSLYYYCHCLSILLTYLQITVVRSFHLYSHNTCGVRTNFPKTIRTSKIVKWAIMLFICTTKTIVGLPVFWNKFGKNIKLWWEDLCKTINAMKWRMRFRFSK